VSQYSVQCRIKGEDEWKDDRSVLGRGGWMEKGVKVRKSEGPKE